MDISTIIVAVIVLGALGYLVKHFVDASTGKGGCSCGGSCSSCHPKGTKTREDELPPCCRGKQ